MHCTPDGVCQPQPSLEVTGHSIGIEQVHRPAGLGKHVVEVFDSTLSWLQGDAPCASDLARCQREMGDAGGDGGECLHSHFEQLTPRCQAALREQRALSPPQPHFCGGPALLLASFVLAIFALRCRRSRQQSDQTLAKAHVVVVDAGPKSGVEVSVSRSVVP
jgi:hypothetical protein